MLGVAPTQVQCLALGLVKPHEIPMGQAPLKYRCSSGVSTAPLNMVLSVYLQRVLLISSSVNDDIK